MRLALLVACVAAVAGIAVVLVTGGEDGEPQAPDVAERSVTETEPATPTEPAEPARPQPARSAFCERVPVYEWQGDVAEREVTVTRPDGEQLEGLIQRPLDLERFPGRRPAVVAAHGKGRDRCDQYWSARTLAGEGYIALTISTGSRQSVEALRGGIDLLQGEANPFAEITDAERIGAVGFSQGATAVGMLQAEDERVQAIVSFDTLVRYISGDPGSASECGELAGEITPRVPAMGQATDEPCTQRPEVTDPELKLAGYEHWREAGVPVMQVVIQGAHHRFWGGRTAEGGREEAERRREFAHYMLAWFDLWLVGDAGATHRLLAREVAGRPVGEVLDERFLSAADIPGAPEACRRDLRGCLLG